MIKFHKLSEQPSYTPYASRMTSNWYMCICDTFTFLNLMHIYTNDVQVFRHFDKRSETSMTRKSTCKNISEEANLPITQKPSQYRASYGHIRYHMKRLSTTLSSKLREGRPRKYYKRCGRELRPSNLCRPKAKPRNPLQWNNGHRPLIRKKVWKHRNKS